MSLGQGFEDEAVGVEEMEGSEFDEQEYEDEGEGEEVCDNIEGNSVGQSIVSDGSRSAKIRRYDPNQYFAIDLNIECQDADYFPRLSDEIGAVLLPRIPNEVEFPHLSDDMGAVLLPRIPNEVETMIFARLPVLELGKLCLLNKRILNLVKSGELAKERKAIGMKEVLVFMLASGEDNWWAFNQKFTRRKTLLDLPSDISFKLADKETLCAGTNLLVFGKEVEGPVIWTYDVMTNKWFKGAPMIEPRCLFASASSGDVAYVAGGTCLASNEILNSAEKYDSETKCWEPLPKMKQKRKMCSGVYMDEKFYVIGGQCPSGQALTCGEVLDESKNTWVKIPGILNGLTTSASPPLVAVVNDELYTFETSTNCLMVYLKNSNSWKDLGLIPVRADINKGWGVAFKSLGTELLVIGGSDISPYGGGMTIYTCNPNPKAEAVDWKLLDVRNCRSPFVKNCTVMVA